MALFDNLFTPSPLAGTAGAVNSTATAFGGVQAPTPADPFMEFLRSFLKNSQTNPATSTQGQTKGLDFPALLKALQQSKTPYDPVGEANKLTSLPSYVPGSQSPFNTGFFKTTY